MSDIPSNTAGSDEPPGGPLTAPAGASGRGVLCAKCEHLNPEGLEKCETCQAHLFIFCSYCGSKNGRVLTRCRKCSRRLKDSLSRRLRSKDRDKGPVNLVYLSLGVAAVIAAAAAAVKFSGVRLW